MFHMRLTVRTLRCYVPKARPNAINLVCCVQKVWLKARDKRREALDSRQPKLLNSLGIYRINIF